MSFMMPNQTTSGSSPSLAVREDTASAMAVSACVEDMQRLREIFKRIDWKLHEARSCRDATKILCSNRMPVVICDGSLPDGNWKDILSLTAPLVESPCVIVMSRSVETDWSTGVLDLGGYAVLKTPIDPTEVTHLVIAASRNWLKTWRSKGPGVSAA
jgi:DNA-binding NtrC family response regulator